MAVHMFHAGLKQQAWPALLPCLLTAACLHARCRQQATKLHSAVNSSSCMLKQWLRNGPSVLPSSAERTASAQAKNAVTSARQLELLCRAGQASG